MANQLVARSRPGEPPHAFTHVRSVPGGAILFLEQNDGARRACAVEASRVEAHQGEQGMDRRNVADGMGGEHPRQPAALITQVAADGMSPSCVTWQP